jgi:hypothetical protein
VRVLITGSRDYEDTFQFNETLDELLKSYDDPIIIAGGAKGADRLAKEYAHMNYLRYLEFPANWPKYKKKAGTLRNLQMLDEGKPHLVIAFPLEGSIGTWHMVKIARERDVEVIVIGE